jgi:putative membrane protein
MKTNKWIYAIMIASLSWVACDEDDDLIDEPSLNETDENFVERAAMTNMAEIQFGELASTKGTDSLIKAFGQHMVDEHTTAQNELEEIADQYDGIEWPNSLDEGNDEIWEQLNGLEGYSFDSLYITTQVMMHQDAETTFETATTNTTEARVKAYANKYLPAIRAHLERADSIQTVIIADKTAG